MSVLQAPAAEALDETSLEGLNKRLDSLEAAAKDKLVEQVSQPRLHTVLHTVDKSSLAPPQMGRPRLVPYSSRDHWLSGF